MTETIKIYRKFFSKTTTKLQFLVVRVVLLILFLYSLDLDAIQLCYFCAIFFLYIIFFHFVSLISLVYLK
jgi:hypothetical protein